MTKKIVHWFTCFRAWTLDAHESTASANDARILILAAFLKSRLSVIHKCNLELKATGDGENVARVLN